MKVKKKKHYEAPKIKARQMRPTFIICESGQTEEYTLGDTSGWY